MLGITKKSAHFFSLLKCWHPCKGALFILFNSIIFFITNSIYGLQWLNKPSSPLSSFLLKSIIQKSSYLFDIQLGTLTFSAFFDFLKVPILEKQRRDWIIDPTENWGCMNYSWSNSSRHTVYCNLGLSNRHSVYAHLIWLLASQNILLFFISRLCKCDYFAWNVYPEQSCNCVENTLVQCGQTNFA